MFDRFTGQARRIVVIAQEQARILRNDHIGTEHLLLGVLETDDGIGARVLNEMGVDGEKLRTDIVDTIEADEESPEGHIPFTPEAKESLELALRAALGLGHRYIGSEHVLLALCDQEEASAGKVLAAHGVTIEGVKQTTLAVLDDPDIESEPSVPTDSLDLSQLQAPPRTVASAPFSLNAPAGPGGRARITPGLIGVLLGLIVVAAATIERPPTAIGRTALIALGAGALSSVVAGLAPLAQGRWMPARGWRIDLGPGAYVVTLVLLSAAALLVVLDGLLA